MNLTDREAELLALASDWHPDFQYSPPPATALEELEAEESHREMCEALASVTPERGLGTLKARWGRALARAKHEVRRSIEARWKRVS